MDAWLNQNTVIEYNLGESGVTDLTLKEIFDMTGCLDEFVSLDFAHNDTLGSSLLRDAVAKLYGSASLHNVLITTGVTEAILLYFNAIYRPNANIVVVTPTFHNLYDYPELKGFEIRKVGLQYANGFKIPLHEIADNLDANTRAIVLTSPNNPTGSILTEDEFNSITAMAVHLDCNILIDEHYRLLPHIGEMLPSFYNPNNNVIVMGSLGKCLGCVGLRVGWLVGNNDILEDCLSFKSFTTHALFKGNDFLALQILKSREALVSKFQKWVRQNINYFEQFLMENMHIIEWQKPQAGTVAFPYLKNTNNTREIAERLLKVGVLVLPGDCFDMPKHFRMRIAVEPGYFKEAIDRMRSVFRDIV